MRRIDTYNLIKLLLCKYGAILFTEKDYEALVTELLAITYPPLKTN
jgi:hypothetical protein